MGTILNNIKEKRNVARLEKDTVLSSIYTLLYSEIAIVGKNNGNRETTDEETLVVIKKMKKNSTETLKALKDKITYPEQISKLNREIKVYESYLPKQMKDDDLRITIKDIIDINSFNSMKDMGKIMGILGKEYKGLYDGKMASQLIKAILLKKS